MHALSALGSGLKFLQEIFDFLRTILNDCERCRCSTESFLMEDHCLWVHALLVHDA